MWCRSQFFVALQGDVVWFWWGGLWVSGRVEGRQGSPWKGYLVSSMGKSFVVALDSCYWWVER